MSIPAMNSNIETLIKPEILQRVKNLNHNLPHFKEIDSLLKKTVLRGGKKIRPLLTFLMGDLFRISLDEMESFASFIELIHAASLSHDDVIDSATQRRGAPSINVLSSNKKAVLAGDYLLHR